MNGSGDEASGQGESGVGTDDGGVVDDVVGGVGGGLGVHADLGDVVNLVVDLVSDQPGLGNQVGLDGPVHGGGGNSNDGGLVVSDGDGGGVGNSDGGSVGVGNGGSVGNSQRGGDSGMAGVGGNSVSGNQAVASVGEAVVSGQAEVSGSVSQAVSGQQLGGGHGGADEGRKDNLRRRGSPRRQRYSGIIVFSVTEMFSRYCCHLQRSSSWRELYKQLCPSPPGPHFYRSPAPSTGRGTG